MLLCSIMLSTTCKYAINAAVFITAKGTPQHKLGVKTITEEIGANEHTTAKILQVLVRAGFIQSVKGPAGGFYVLPGAPPFYLMDIVQLIDGTGFFFKCGLGLGECSEKKPCSIHHSFKAARALLFKEFSTVTIQKLAVDIKLGAAFLKY